MVAIHVGIHADGDGRLFGYVFAKGSCHVEAVCLVQLKTGFTEHNFHHGMSGGFGAYEFVNVLLVEVQPWGIFHTELVVTLLDKRLFSGESLPRMSIQPSRKSSAIKSIIPDPQIPFASICRGFPPFFNASCLSDLLPESIF